MDKQNNDSLNEQWLDDILGKRNTTKEIGLDEAAMQAAGLTHPDDMELERIVQETPSVFDDFMIVLEGKKQLLVFQSIIAFTYLFFLIVLMIYTSVLYYIHQAKDISVKLLNGYGFWSVFFYRMVFKVSVILLISVISFFVKCNIIIALLIVLTELLIFSAVMRKMSMERITTVLKGD